MVQNRCLYLRNNVRTGIRRNISNGIVVEWRIPQFSTLSRKVDDRYHSPGFTFLGNCWYLRIYCNGQSAYASEGYTGLFLAPENITIPCTISFTFSLKNARENLVYQKHPVRSVKFEIKNIGLGFQKFFKNSDVTSRGDDLLPQDVLTVRCMLRNGSYDKVSLVDRLLNVSHTMMKILEEEKRTDVVLKVEGEEIKAHRVILEARSEVFQKMFSHDMLENRTGEIKIEDVESDVFQEVLGYMYGGIAEVTPENARSLYVAADRFNLKELKTLCVDFLKESMSDDLFCDAFVVADMHNETDLMKQVKEYLGKNAGSIIKTEKWKQLVEEDSKRSTQILTTLVTLNADESK